MKKYLWLTLAVIGIMVFMKVVLADKTVPQSHDKSEERYLDKLFEDSFDSDIKTGWYGEFKKALIKEGLSLINITDSELTDDKKYYVLLVSDQYCEKPSVYRFSTDEYILERAKVDAKNRQCLSSGGFFSTGISGNVSEFFTSGGDAGCTSNQFFYYDVKSNQVALIKEKTFCEGGTDDSWTYY